MINADEISESPGSILCKSCGLCCSGHLFAWVKLRSPELVPLENLGVNVTRDPRQRGFNQPCPLWNGQCTIYQTSQYPHFCRQYKCQLLKRLMDGTTSLPEALSVVKKAKEAIGELNVFLPPSPNPNFRERLVAHIESANTDPEFTQKAEALLHFCSDQFGVKDIINNLE